VWQVSPYLRLVELAPSDYGVDTPCAMLFDELHGRNLVISVPAYDAMMSAASRDGVLSDAELAVLEPELAFLREHAAIVPAELAFRMHRYLSIEIEITRHCNYRCVFCPVSVAPKPKGVMSRELFAQILDRVVEYGAPMISLNHYSEPTLHPEFVELCELAAARQLKVRLHSNLSVFDVDCIDRVKPAIGLVIANLPSVDPETYAAATGARPRQLERVLTTLERLHAAGIPVILSINTPRDRATGAVHAINERLGEMFGPSVRWWTDDRAGRMDIAGYARPVTHAGRLSGCEMATSQINVSSEALVFLCCQDFDQRYVVGDLRVQSLRDIVEGPDMVRLRSQVLGGSDAPPDLICRRCTKTSPRRGAFLFSGTAKRLGPTEEAVVSDVVLAAQDRAG
jgi:hypothetical protein